MVMLAPHELCKTRLWPQPTCQVTLSYTLTHTRIPLRSRPCHTLVLKS